MPSPSTLQLHLYSWPHLPCLLILLLLSWDFWTLVHLLRCSGGAASFASLFLRLDSKYFGFVGHRALSTTQPCLEA